MKQGIGLFIIGILLFVGGFILIPRFSNMSAEQVQGWKDWANSKQACERDSPIKRNDLVQLVSGTKFIMVEACYSSKKAWVLDSDGNDVYIPLDLLTKVEN